MKLTLSNGRRPLAASVVIITLTAGLVGTEWLQKLEAGASPAPASAHLAQSELHEVSISVNVATGEFTYSLNPVYAKRGDRIQWTSEQGAWSVTFQQGVTPFDVNSARGQRRAPKQLAIRADATNRSYKYTVGLVVDGDVFTDDPEIIIGP